MYNRDKLSSIKKGIIYLLIFVVYFIFFFKFWEFDIHVPFSYFGKDDFVFAMTAKNAMIGGWTQFYNPDLGAPYGQELYSFPMIWTFYFYFCKVCSFFTSNYAIAMNLYYFFTYFISVVTFMYFCKKVNIRSSFAFVGGMCFSFTQYHLLRGIVHMTATAYFAIPLAMLFCYYIATDYYEKRENLKFKSIEAIIMCILIASTDMFYTYFGCFIILLTGFIMLIRKKYKAALYSLSIILVLVLLSALFLSPSIFHILQDGGSLSSLKRSTYGAFFYGLIIESLFMPGAGSKNLLSFITDIFYADPVSKQIGVECFYNYLGIVGLVGFALELLVLLIPTMERRKHFAKVRIISVINIFIILLCTSGGIGFAVALLITDKIRTYTRGFVYILFLSIISSILLLEYICDKYKVKRNIKAVILSSILIITLIDTSSWSLDREGYKLLDYETTTSKFYSDKSFFSKIQELNDAGNLILELPQVPGLENSVNGEGNVNYLLKGYLLTDNLKWSYGAREGTKAYEEIKKNFDVEPAAAIIPNAIKMGYTGIYIVTSMLEEGSVLVTNLESFLGEPKVINDSGALLYFDLSSKTDLQDEISKFIPYAISYGDGFYPLEKNEKSKWRWAGNVADLYIHNNTQEENVIIELTASSISEDNNVIITVNGNEYTFDISTEDKDIYFETRLVAGINVVQIKSNAVKLEELNDDRELSIRITDIAVTAADDHCGTFLNSGFYDTETGGGGKWNWSESISSVTVYNASNSVINNNLSIDLLSVCEGNSELQVSLNNRINKYNISNSLSSINVPLELYPGKNIVSFDCNARKGEETEDTRELSFAIYRMEISKDE